MTALESRFYPQSSPSIDDIDPSDVNGRAFRAGRREALRLALDAGERPAAFTAAAQVVDLGAARSKAKYGKRSSTGWQEDGWIYYDALPEVKRGAQFKSRSLGKLGTYLTYRPAPDEPPVPLAEVESEAPALAVGVARDVTSRIDAGDGALQTMLGRWGSNGFVAGEGFIVVWDDLDAPSGRSCRFCSIDELRVNEKGEWGIADDPAARPETWLMLPSEDTLVIRVWNQHARYADLPDSSVRGILELCEHLALLQGLGLGVTMSRMNGGVLLLPDTMLARRRRPGRLAEDGNDAQHRDPIIDRLMEQVVTPIEDPRSAAAAAPLVLSGSRADIEAVRHITFDRAYDGVADERTQALITRIANGVDLPAEVLLGMADLNHWTAWLISDETYRSYVEPDGREFMTALATGYLHPSLLAAGVPFEEATRFGYGLDPSELVADPDETDRVFKAHEALIIGGDAARRRLRFGEDEAPTTEDVDLARAAKGRTDPASPTEGEPATSGADGADGAVTAAASIEGSDPRLVALAERWVDRDRALRNRLQTMADAAMVRALDRAGAQLRSRSSRNRLWREAVDGVPNRRVAAQLGPGLVRQVLAQGDDDLDVEALLLTGAWEELVARFTAMTARAQASTLDELEALGVDPSTLEALESQQAEGRDRAAVLLAASLSALAVARLYDPSPAAEPGESDPNLTVPAGIPRAVLSTAGGAEGTIEPGGAVVSPVTDVPAGGVAAGDSTMTALGTIGITPLGYRWSYGDPALRGTPFEPHRALDGLAFRGWTDPVLANTGSWPRVAFFRPGDHRGCECDAYPILAAASPLTFAP